jgi:hypothetical protein
MWSESEDALVKVLEESMYQYPCDKHYLSKKQGVYNFHGCKQFFWVSLPPGFRLSSDAGSRDLMAPNQFSAATLVAQNNAAT